MPPPYFSVYIIKKFVLTIPILFYCQMKTIISHRCYGKSIPKQLFIAAHFNENFNQIDLVVSLLDSPQMNL